MLYFLLWPTSLGGDVSYVMVRGVSMEPTLHPGELAVMRTQDGYKPGDVVAYRVPEDEFGAGAVII
ncbi:MAG: S24 family peptidase, partial [Chloroflexi bacterium]|nr:S24 family peptidase [Chloroflexota bacterium]